MIRAEQVEQDIREEVRGLSHAELVKFAEAMGVEVSGLTDAEIVEECVRIELHCAFH